MSAEGFELCRVLGVKQTRTNACRFPALEHLGLHGLSVGITANKPKFMGVRMPPIHAKKVFKGTNKALIAHGLFEALPGTSGTQALKRKGLLLEQ
jgi:hypothetical protein